MRQLLARHVEQEAAMPALRELARGDVLFPDLIGNDQRDLRMRAQAVDRRVGAGIVIGDDRVHMGCEIIERIGQQQRFVPHAREPDQKMLPPEQRLIALDDPLAVAERPLACTGGHLRSRMLCPRNDGKV
jgi:hypothetical protein